MRNAFAEIAITVLIICVGSQQLRGRPQDKFPEVEGDRQGEFVTQKLIPLATEVSRPKDWFFWKDDVAGDFNWIISKEKLDQENRQFKTGYEIKAFYNVEKKTKQSPEDFAADYLKKSLDGQEMKILHRAKQQAGPLTALTQTVELADGISATDLYWGDGKQLDVMVVVERKAPKKQWNASQRVFKRMNFSLRTVVQGTRDKPRIDDRQQQ